MKHTESNKHSTRGLSGSLAFRVVFTEALFLVIPLLIFSGVLYYEESKAKARDTLVYLTLLLEGRKQVLQSVIEDQRGWLVQLSRGLLKLDAVQNLQNELPPLHFFHLTKRKEGYVCDASSDPGLLGKNFSPLLGKNLIYANGTLVGRENSPFFYLFEQSMQKGEIWGASLSRTYLLNKLVLKEPPFDLAVISLLSEKGTVLLSSNAAWKGEKWALKSAQKKEVFLPDKAHRGRVEKVANSSLFLGVTLPKQFNPVEPAYFLVKMGGLFLIILTVGGSITYFFTLRLSRPLKKLCSVMHQVGSSDLSARYQADRMGFEINIVGNIFNNAITSLLTSLQRAESERLAKEVFQRELMIGQAVQKSILPTELPPFPGLDIATYFIPAKEVGGDFYDVLTFPKTRQHLLFFSIADTSGKGIDACFYSLSVRSMLRSYAQESPNLEQIIQKTNHLFCLDTGDTGVFVTTWLGLFDQNTRLLTFSNCGHFPAYLVHENRSFETLTTQGMALGVQPFEQVKTKTVQLKTGDLLFLFTDGMVEARNQDSQVVGSKKLVEWLIQTRDLSPHQIIKEVMEKFQSFTQGLAQEDDLTLLACKVQ